ncbi:hypothetical protein J3F83DRAFT_103199 [Trichoderma novae-zelandiae]
MAQNTVHEFTDNQKLFHANNFFYEEKNPESSELLGGFKTTNPSADRFQRPIIHISPTRSKFKKTVELVLCAHGWKSPDKKEPMTLLILGVNLSCHDRDFRFQSVRIWLTFDEDDKRDATSTLKASPRVVAFAPFVQQERWNFSVANITDSKTLGGSLGAAQFASAEVNGSRSHEISYTRKHFDRGCADRLYDEETGTFYGIEWYCEQNKLQEYGVQPNFHLAVLLERSHDEEEKPIPFKAMFEMQIEAGFMHDLKQGLRRVFRLRKPEDDPVYFDPSREPSVRGLAGIGQKLLQEIDIDNLGVLAEGKMLSKLLIGAGGSLSGFEPMLAV